MYRAGNSNKPMRVWDPIPKCTTKSRCFRGVGYHLCADEVIIDEPPLHVRGPYALALMRSCLKHHERKGAEMRGVDWRKEPAPSFTLEETCIYFQRLTELRTDESKERFNKELSTRTRGK